MQISIDASPQFLGQLELLIQQSVIQAVQDIVKEDRVMTKKEVAEFLQISIPTLDLFMRRYELPYFHCGQVIRFLYSDVKHWFRANQNLVDEQKGA